MSEIRRYFDDLESNLRSRDEIVSVRTESANRSGPKFEKREYKAFLHSSVDDTADLQQDISRNLQVDVEEDSDEHALIVNTAYDANP